MPQRAGARNDFLWIVDVAGVELVDHFGGRVTEHALGADVEELNDALLVGGDDREVGAGEDSVLQRPGFQEIYLTVEFADDLGAPGPVTGDLMLVGFSDMGWSSVMLHIALQAIETILDRAAVLAGGGIQTCALE